MPSALHGSRSAKSQNHQYALKLQDPFPAGWEPFFINCNDSSVEGIKSTAESGKNVWGVQFHPESAGGPLDTVEVKSSDQTAVSLLG
jgi:carbamoyl-phosphate synthase small subunit